MNKLYIKLRSTGLIAAVGVILLGAGGNALAATQNNNQTKGNQEFQASLTQLNASGATGFATASVDANDMGHFHITVAGLINAPHAQHIHFGPAAAHECPAITSDTNKDGIVDTVEGSPAYGPVQTSLTTNGDTSPTSTLAVDRYPTYADSAEYDREFQLTPDQAQQIRSGLSVVVVHGIDSIVKNGKYDGDLKSELDPSLPQEATAPAACGLLHYVSQTVATSTNSNGSTNTDYASKTMSFIAIGLGAVALLLALSNMMRRSRTDA